MECNREPSGKSGQALHIKGFLGKSIAPKWVSLMCGSIMDAKGQTFPIDISGSIGISFRARSEVDNVILVGVDAVVEGKSLIGDGRSHRTSIPMGKEWKTFVRYWDEFSQPSYACQSDKCVGPLTVDQVGLIGWNATEEGKPVDFWLDDIELLYGKK